MTTDFRKQGKANRAAGKRFETKVRLDLEGRGFIVDKWTNNVQDGKLVPSKPKFNPFTKSLMMNSSGFPDFIAFKVVDDIWDTYRLFGVECKMGKYLSEEEKKRCIWLIEHKVFPKILIASPGEKRGSIAYREFK
jgi:hypothetical protein